MDITTTSAKSNLSTKQASSTALPAATLSSFPISLPPLSKPVKKYACCFCDRGFSRSEHRSRHERSHTKERPFHCSKCSSTFVRRDLLLRHDRTVHGTAKRDQSKSTRKEIKNNNSYNNSGSNSNNINSSNDNNDNTSYISSSSGANNNIKSNTENLSSVSDNTPPPASAASNVGNSRKRRRSVTNKQNFKDQNSFLNVFSIKQKIKHEPCNVSASTTTHPAVSSLLCSVSSVTKNTVREPHSSKNNKIIHNNTISSLVDHTKFVSLTRPLLRSTLVPELQTSLPNHKPELNSTPVSAALAAATTNVALTGQLSSVTNFTVPQLGAAFSLSDLFANLEIHHEEHLITLSLTLCKLQLNRYLSAYFYYFHPTLPFLHTNSFVPTDQRLVQAPLLFGVCSIGALLCREKQVSVLLHNASRFLAATQLGRNAPVSSSLANISITGGSSPLWLLQTLITHLVYCAWCGDVRGFEYLKTLRPTVAALVRAALAKQLQHRKNRRAAATATKSRSEFIETECVLRAYYAVFVLLGSCTVVFDCAPLPLFLPGEIPEDAALPCSELFWNSSLSVSEFAKHPNHAPKFQTIFRQLAQPDGANSISNINITASDGLSPMAIRVLGTALFLDVWRANATVKTTANDRAALQHRLNAFGLICTDPEPGQGQLISHFLVNSPPIAMALVIDDTNSSGNRLDIIHRLRTHQHPLVLDSYILSLVAELRVHIDLALVKKTIQRHEPHEIASAAYNTLVRLMANAGPHAPVLSYYNQQEEQQHLFERTNIVELVRKCFEFIKVILLPGLNLSISFFEASSNWLSTESILNLFETSLVLVMWCHHHHCRQIQKQQQQQNERDKNDNNWAAGNAFYAEIEKTLRESGPPSPTVDVAAAAVPVSLCLVMADFLHACREAWGIAELLGSALRIFAYQMQSASAPPSLPLQQHQNSRAGIIFRCDTGARNPF